MAHHWYPQHINGHTFHGKGGDFIRIPERFLENSAPSQSKDENCRFVQFTEYSSQQWFITGDKGTALQNKVWLLIFFIIRMTFFVLQNKNSCLQGTHIRFLCMDPHPFSVLTRDPHPFSIDAILTLISQSNPMNCMLTGVNASIIS